MHQKPLVSTFGAALVTTLGLAATAHAATYDWTGTDSNNLSGIATNWSPDLESLLPDDVLRWDAAIYTGTAPTANAIMSFGQMLFGSGNTNGITFGTGTSTLTLNGVSGIGIQMDSGTGAVSTGSAKFALGADQSWINNDDNLLTVAGTITNADNSTAKTLTIGGTGNTTLTGIISNNTGGAVTAVTKNGAGTLTLGGNNSFTGDLLINGGIVVTGSANGRRLGSITAPTTGSVIADGATSQVQITGGNSFGQNATTENNRSLVAKNGGAILTSGNNVANRIGNVTLQGGTMSINSTRVTDYGGFHLGTVNGGQQATVTVSGGTGAYANTPSVINFTAGVGNLALDMNTQFNVADVTGDASADLTVSAKLILGTLTPNAASGAGFTKLGAGTMELTAANTYNGNTTVSAGNLTLADNAQIKFVLGATSGTNNALTGAGTVTLDGDFVIDTTAADGLTSGTWTLENVASMTGAYGNTFSVVGFSDAGSNKWTKVIGGGKTYTFDETTGILTLASGSDYDTWGAPYGLSSGSEDGDLDGDGLTNFHEYAFGLIPNSGTSVNPISQQVNKATGLFKYTRRAGSTGVTYTYESSSTLGAWSEFTPDSATSNSGGPVEEITVDVPDVLLANPSLFIRVKASKP